MKLCYLCLMLYVIATKNLTDSNEPGKVTLQRSIERFLKALGPWDGKRPDAGYLPYWSKFDWVSTTKANKTKKTKSTKLGQVTLPPLPVTGMCGEHCPIRYKRYGYVCARNKKNLFKSFKNLCEMTNSDCSGKMGWMIVYRGNCSQDFLGIFPTVTVQQHAKELISNFYSTTRITTIDLSKEEASELLASSESYDSPEENFEPENNDGRDWWD